MSDLISIKRLTGSTEELASLQKVFESVPSYLRKLTGEGPSKTCAQDYLNKGLPEGVEDESHYLYGIYFNHDMIGCFDLIKNYPEEKLATLNLLIIDYEVQGAGLGSEAYKEVEAMVREWEEFQKIRIPFVKTLDAVMPFWRKMGFRKTSENSPYESGSVKSKVVILEKNLNKTHNNNNNNNNNHSKNNNNNRKGKYSNKKNNNRRPHSGGGRHHQNNNNNQNFQKAPAMANDGGDS